MESTFGHFSEEDGSEATDPLNTSEQPSKLCKTETAFSDNGSSDIVDNVEDGGEKYVTKAYFDQAIESLYQRLREAAKADHDELKAVFAKGMQSLSEKLDSTISKVCKPNGKRSALLTVPTIDVPSPEVVLGGSDLRAKGRLILLHVIPFNLMGKACDIYFACQFVQEQLCAFISPYLSNLSASGIHNVVAKTCLMTFFTPLARAHMIYGKNANSMKMLSFNKRPLPDGMHRIIDKYFIQELEETIRHSQKAYKLYANELRTCCASTFNIDRSCMMTNAVSKTRTNDEAAEVVCDCDFKFYEHNKHTLTWNTKVPTREKHMAKTKERNEFKKGLIEQAAGIKSSSLLPSIKSVFDDMKAKCVHEILDPIEMIKLICVAAHCMNQDYTKLMFDQVSCIPELSNLYQEVLLEIVDIDELVNQFSLNSRKYLPEVLVPSRERKEYTHKKEFKNFPFEDHMLGVHVSSGVARGKNKKRLAEDDLISFSDSESNVTNEEIMPIKRQMMAETVEDDFPRPPASP